MDSKVYEFDAVIKKVEDIDGAFIEFPYDVQKEFGVKGQVKVKAAFGGHEYRGSLVKMGSNCHILGMTKAIRSAIGKEPGDTVHITIMQDTEPRVIEIPEDLQNLLDQNSNAKSFFECLSFTNRKDYVNWITNAKKAETREKRLVETVEKLSKREKLK